MADFTATYVPTLPTIGTATSPDASYASPDVTVTMYYQRVWDTVYARWCFYEKDSIDATPGTTETSPVNSGSITSHSVVSERVT